MELWDLYDKDRNMLPEKMKRGDKIPDGCYHLVVHLSLFNSKGEMLIQRRQTFKHGWSGLWDITVGGSVVAGENSRIAIEREVEEELGLHISFADERPVITSYFDDGIGDMYVINRDVDLSELKLQKSEVMDAKWASKEEILAMIDDGSFIPYCTGFIELAFHLRHTRHLRVRPDDTKPY